MKKIIYQIALVSLFLTFVTGSVLAEERIDNFKTQINIDQSGLITVEERIDYNFGSLSKHGIFRYIPYIKTNQENKRYRLEISKLSVTDEQGTAYHFSKSQSGDNLALKIGDSNSFVTGSKVYVIKYEVAGAMTYFSDHDELIWNLTGNQWDLTIASTTAEISYPALIKSESIQLACYTGLYKSKEKDCLINNKDDKIVVIANNQLVPQSGLTAAISLPKGIIAVLEPKEAVGFFETVLGKITLFLLAILGICWYLLYPIWLPIKWYLYGRDPSSNNGPVRSWYDPPKTKDGRELTPAETGTLIDEKVDVKDILGMIIDLARRGYFKIVEKKKQDFYLLKQKDFKKDKGLMSFEKKFLSDILTTDEVRLKDLSFASTFENISKQIYERQVADGFFPKNPNTIRNFYLAIIALSAISMNFQLLIMALLFGRAMPKKTIFGVEQKNVALSLKNFLQSQERQLNFQAKNQMMFEKLLPYAVVFGVEKIWAQRFKDLNINQPDWYSSYNHQQFSSILLINSLNSSFSTIKSTMTSTTSSSGFSSGFSSGGFSGGGGGGGGGGSW